MDWMESRSLGVFASLWSEDDSLSAALFGESRSSGVPASLWSEDDSLFAALSGESRSLGVFASLRSEDDSLFAEGTFVFTPSLLYSFTPPQKKTLLYSPKKTLLYSSKSSGKPLKLTTQKLSEMPAFTDTPSPRTYSGVA